MSYETYRKQFIANYYDYQLEQLVSQFRPTRDTVILLPGGMGSQLERTRDPYPSNANVFTDVVWVDPGIVFALDALKLEIDAQGKDKDSHVIAAHGPVSLPLIGLTPYEELESYASAQGWNYGVFGFDWRRPIEECSQFLKDFIFEFKRRIVRSYNVDPIPRLTIVCHSMGGLVCTDALQDNRFSSLGFNAIVTIATPFYGTSTQQERYFVGIPEFLNPIYKAKNVVRIVASLPGPFTLMFLPKSIYLRDGLRLGLTRYPEYDPNGNTSIDPYETNSAVLRRWPKDVRDHRQYLIDARRSMERISTPIDNSIAPRFFNVRSSLDHRTAVELLWNNVDGDDIIPGTTPSPLAGIPGPGDGTVPAWSAWHAYCRPGNRHELKQASDHASLLEHKEVLTLIESIVETRTLPVTAKRTPRSAVASDKKLESVVTKWVSRAKEKRPAPPELFEPPVQRAITASLLGGKKPRLVRRPPQRSSGPRKRR
jgi:hypothetical protein